jgi:hypothetical protein
VRKTTLDVHKKIRKTCERRKGRQGTKGGTYNQERIARISKIINKESQKIKETQRKEVKEDKELQAEGQSRGGGAGEETCQSRIPLPLPP